uniref:ATP-citrate synthase n=1 Tax=Amorphochlora amoebiformis TaxID=1561963 RepID=A0A7S0D1I8_9EUKA|mmetsp:Transcript_17476/g.27821  ORF Transcript_17476/g.27821 Transcript_17476/m.27821 type:complete len:1094 (+) Transcript_17476:66-3347(+)
MSQKAIREHTGKRLLTEWFSKKYEGKYEFGNMALVSPSTDLKSLPNSHGFLKTEKLVAKPDQLIKRRGKLGLVKLKATWEDAKKWIEERRGKELKVGSVKDTLDFFLVETFVPHKQEEEYYVCIQSVRGGEKILFYHEGGVDIGDVDSKAEFLTVEIGKELTSEIITKGLLAKVPNARQPPLADFICRLFEFYQDNHFAYLEINPVVMIQKESGFLIAPLDMAAKLDETARFECYKKWGDIDFPAPFGRTSCPEESYIESLDAKTGASLKLTILNRKGRVWTMVAGGGASVIYADTVCDLGAAPELANYGEYSGAPTMSLTYKYAKTILSLMCDEIHPKGKVLIIGGGIANFTNVADTFKGIIAAMQEYATQMIEGDIKVFVRRGGPNFQEGLENMRQFGTQYRVPIKVFGPEDHMTNIVALALGKDIVQVGKTLPRPNSAADLLQRGRSSSLAPPEAKTAAPIERKKCVPGKSPPKLNPWDLFTAETRCFIYGMQPTAVQNMLDFDFVSGRAFPSVACLVYPFSGNHSRKFYWNTKEVLIPVFASLEQALKKFPDISVVVNFASSRSAFESTIEILKHSKQIKTHAIIAEGVPEQKTKLLIKKAKDLGVTIIGPATVGGIKPGCFRIGNTGGALDNIIASKLYRPGSVAYVARSGGLSNELNNIISQHTDGVYEGIPIGGDRFPGTTFMDHLLRYEANPDIKMMVLLGEVGGVEEYEVCRALESKKITKPLVALCTGTCASAFSYEVQFGHAGACAQGESETASAKNTALKKAGAVVPNSFNEMGLCIRVTYRKLVKEGVVIEKIEPAPPQMPVDYKWARKLGLIRKPSAFMSSISDERGQELVYGGMKLSEVFEKDLGIGGVLGLLWFRRKLPKYFTKFIEMVLMVTADHGPAVSGAHNTIVAARAGKDLVSSLCSGLLTIGPRFGGALDDAARKFSWAFDTGLLPEEFVTTMRKKKELIPGIGHKVKSLENPDIRVEIIKKFAHEEFKTTPLLDYALRVQAVTTRKKTNLILNVDGCIAVCFVDLLRNCGAFTRDEADMHVENGTLNGLFVLGRSIGFIGHFIDQKRLKQGLYRHPHEDIWIVPFDQDIQ